MIVIVIAQISTNMAANVVSPSNDFSNLAPEVHLVQDAGGIITAVIGIISFPWVLFNSAGAYIFTWLDRLREPPRGHRGRHDRGLLDPAPGRVGPGRPL